MLCPIGLTLFAQYELAEREKNVLKGQGGLTTREAHAAKQRYVEKFADWMGHKAFCQDCKPKAGGRGELGSNGPGR